MAAPQHSLVKEVFLEHCKRHHFGLFVFNFWFVIFFNLQSFGEGLDFCFNGSKGGYRLNTQVIKYVHAKSGVDCIVQCLLQDKSCRSVNFRKTTACGENENCELLGTVDLEEPAESLKENANFDYLILDQPYRKLENPVSPSTTPSEKTAEIPTTLQQPSASCEELLNRNSSLTSGVYSLQNNVTREEYKTYCHMTEIPECGEGGWTLVMKVNGRKNTFKTGSHLWTNTSVYEDKNGLEGLTEKETKLASFWNTPFQKLCIGMKVREFENEQWIVIDQKASSLFNVISRGKFTPTNISLSKWKSLIQNSTVQEYRSKQGFNIPGGENNEKILVRIGLLACKNKACNCKSYMCKSCMRKSCKCDSCKCNSCQCNSFIGFGAAITGCCGASRKKACGSIHACQNTQNNIDAFGYILVK